MNIYEIGALQGWPKSWVDQLLEIQPRSKVGAGFGDAMSLSVLMRVLPRALQSAGLLDKFDDVWEQIPQRGPLPGRLYERDNHWPQAATSVDLRGQWQWWSQERRAEEVKKVAPLDALVGKLMMWRLQNGSCEHGIAVVTGHDDKTRHVWILYRPGSTPPRLHRPSSAYPSNHGFVGEHGCRQPSLHDVFTSEFWRKVSPGSSERHKAVWHQSALPGVPWRTTKGISV